MKRPLRIAMLAHSTNPRGGVVHAMQLSEALVGLGHEVVLYARDAKGKGFFRAPKCEALALPVGPAPADRSIAEAMALALNVLFGAPLRERGRVPALRFDWRSLAQAHEPVYQRVREPVHA